MKLNSSVKCVYTEKQTIKKDLMRDISAKHKLILKNGSQVGFLKAKTIIRELEYDVLPAVCADSFLLI
jgi:hypothetical protein